MNKQARLILVERTPRWSVLLRRLCLSDRAKSKGNSPLLEARSLALAEDFLLEYPASFVAVAISSNAEDQIKVAEQILQLSRWLARFPWANWGALVDHQHPERDLGLREAGAQVIIHSWQELPLLMKMVRRHLLRRPATHPQGIK